MRSLLPALFAGTVILSACGGGTSGVSETRRLLVEPEDGRAPIMDVIAGARDNIRLTIYEITDLHSVTPQSPPAPVAGIAQALIEKAKSGVSVRVIVDQAQYGGTSTTDAQVRQTVAALRSAGVDVKTSSTGFCFTHQKSFVVDGPTAANPFLRGTAIIMSLNLMPGYFSGTRDYAVVTGNPGVVGEISRVFDSDFALVGTATCSAAHFASETAPPPSASDTPPLSEPDLVWSPVSAKPKLRQLIGSAKKSLVLTTEELTDSDMTCQILEVARSAARPAVRILLSGDTGSNAAAVNKLVSAGLPNLSIRVMPGQTNASSPTPPPTPTPLYMHGKQVIADEAQAFVGSENLTNTSLLQNRELGILFTDPAMVARLQSVFDRDFGSSVNSTPAQACGSGADCKTINCGAGT